MSAYKNSMQTGSDYSKHHLKSGHVLVKSDLVQVSFMGSAQALWWNNHSHVHTSRLTFNQLASYSDSGNMLLTLNNCSMYHWRNLACLGKSFYLCIHLYNSMGFSRDSMQLRQLSLFANRSVNKARIMWLLWAGFASSVLLNHVVKINNCNLFNRFQLWVWRPQVSPDYATMR